ncbi:amidohydrolase family protein [Neisseriaceae bacterium B1]
MPTYGLPPIWTNSPKAQAKTKTACTPQTPQWDGEAVALKLAQTLNNAYADIIKRHPGRFRAYGCVPLPYTEAAIAEGKRCIEELGFDGIALNTIITMKHSPADDQFEPFYQAMNELGTIIYIHPTGCGANSPMINDFGLEWVIGANVEDMVATLQILKKALPKKYPKLRFHIAHLGGVLPFVMQRIEDNYTDWNAFAESPWKTLDNFWFDTAGSHAPAWRCTVETFGSERVVLGSDFPYFQDDKYTRAVTYVQNAGLGEQVTEDSLRNNALKLL